jgi:uncharacterized membrane protein YccC
MEAKAIRKFVVASEHPTSITHAARTTVAAVAALLVARLLRLPEAYWAPISTIVVMPSTLKAALSISAQRFAGTAVGAAAGAVAAIYFPGNTLAFGLAVFTIGMLCAAFQVDRTAYRYAGITLAIVILIPRQEKPLAVAMHRFTEVSLGIAAGLALTMIWPDRPTAPKYSVSYI